ncbi:MAG: hypothetical protein AB8F74_20615 [Saprospiraceae bacterium]
MRFFFAIVLLGIWCSISTPAFGQVKKSSKSTKRIKKNKRSKSKEVISEFDLEYKLDCTLKLERARTLFEKGLLEKIPKLLSDCADRKDLSSSTREDIYKLLAETHLFLNEEDIAADYYEKLLKIEPFFEVQPLIDHPEFVHLSKRFKTMAPFSFGFKSGLRFTQINSKKQFLNTATVSSLQDTYNGEWDILGGAFVAYRPGGGNLELNMEVLYSSYTYGYEGEMNATNPTDSIRLVFNEDARFFQLPLSAKYLFGSKNLRPYAFAGVSPMFIQKARLESLRATVSENGNFSQEQNTGVDISKDSNNPLRNRINLSTHIGLGLQYDLKRFYLFADVRYDYMLTNAVDEDNRLSNNDLTDRFFHVDNDFGVNGIGISIGFGYSFYRTVRLR